ncbi:NAD(P)/FAD-dependent oxidoreductase [Ignavibacteriales bacterium]
MTPEAYYDNLVIGGGYGGLVAAALLAKAGKKTLLLEAHTVPAGCASFYSRKGIIFDAGATTLSGMAPGQPMATLFNELGIEPEVKRLDPGMIIKFGERELVRYADLNAWIAETERFFKLPGLRAFWELVHWIDKTGYSLIGKNRNLPPVSVSDLISLAKPSNLKGLPLLPYLFKSTETVMKRFGLHEDPLFRSFIDEQLLITTQNTAGDSPFLTAALGLAYPAETYYPYGGLFFPAKEIEKKFKAFGGEVKYKKRVVAITKTGNGYLVKTGDGSEYRSAGVVTNIPLWNIPELTSGEEKRYFEKIMPEKTNAWGAFMVNFAFDYPFEEDVRTAYWQIHVPEGVPHCESKSFFVTFSLADDLKKAPKGMKSVTISLHTKSENWFGFDHEEYRKRKEETGNFILRKFDEAFPGMAVGKKHVEFGTPATFQKYTFRSGGLVGGVPHSVKNNLLKMHSGVTPFKGFYNTGDTVFPGQGTVAVTIGAMNIVKRILDKA